MMLRRFMLALFVVVCTSFTAFAQNQSASAPASADQLLKPQELDALVAPIALYPDNLLSLVLMVSTYPMEIVQADRWIKENKRTSRL